MSNSLTDLAEFVEESLLQPGGGRLFLLSFGEQSHLVYHQLLLEVKAHRLVVLSPIPEGADELDSDLLVIEELVVDLQDPVHRVGAGDVVNEVSSSEIYRYFTIERGLLENSEGYGHGQSVSDLPHLDCRASCRGNLTYGKSGEVSYTSHTATHIHTTIKQNVIKYLHANVKMVSLAILCY